MGAFPAYSQYLAISLMPSISAWMRALSAGVLASSREISRIFTQRAISPRRRATSQTFRVRWDPELRKKSGGVQACGIRNSRPLKTRGKAGRNRIGVVIECRNLRIGGPGQHGQHQQQARPGSPPTRDRPRRPARTGHVPFDTYAQKSAPRHVPWGGLFEFWPRLVTPAPCCILAAMLVEIKPVSGRCHERL